MLSVGINVFVQFSAGIGHFFKTYFSSLNPQSSTSLRENYMYNKQEPNSVLAEMSWHKVQVI